ncbi:helix-turn-helix transcriptional regulator [Terrisporobacter muris]|uniref:Helix-turn-helix domain-containing protein n=1 Tax=Terrisporobacter muris TaxID=2963284 RepID=A0A9X2MBD8_9FIRM|nr:helix-turn-helix transcriptional regulator [Terrisporobacter muris]MCR1822730.1 helix-turn-helix domain-containing protein [Terrisporobacter muris]
MEQNKLGNNIRREREARKLTQEELGKILGVSKQTVSSWEKGDKKPRVDKLNSLAELFNSSVDDLLEKTSIPSESEKYYKVAKEIYELDEEDRKFIKQMIKKLKKNQKDK